MATKIYKFDFPSGKSYIGIERIGRYGSRYKDHAKGAAKGRMTRLCTAWRKYGPPKQIILAIVEDAEALVTEQRAIAIYKTLSPGGYNMTPGGDFNPMDVPEIRNNPKTKAKRSRSARLRAARMTPKQKKEHARKTWAGRRANGTDRGWKGYHPCGLPAWNKGIPHSEKTRKKIVKSLSGKKTRRLMSQAMTNYWEQWRALEKQITEETRSKMKTSQRKRYAEHPVTDAEKNRRSQGQLKRYAICPMTEETKMNISKSKVGKPRSYSTCSGVRRAV